MSFEVFDYRTDVRNLLVTSQIRSRFLRLGVGEVSRSHTHDLAPEVFLVLQGRAEFEIGGRKRVVGPGRMCIARMDEPHTVRNVGEEDVIMYLSVTPHIQPTHTYWTEDGKKEPPRFLPSTAYDVELDRTTPTDDLIDRHLKAVETLAGTVENMRNVHREQGAAFKKGLAQEDEEAALQARDEMWKALYTTFRHVYEMADAWNEFTARTADREG